MAYSLIAHVSATLTNTGSTSSINTTGADFIVVGVTNYAGGGGSRVLSDSKSNTWSACTSQAGAVSACQIYYVQAPTVGSGHTFTLTDANPFYGTIFVQAWSGSASSPLDQQNGTVTASSVIFGQPGSITPSQNSELLIFLMGTCDQITTPYVMSDSFTQPDPGISWQSGATEGGGMGYLVQATAAAINPTAGWTAPNNFGVALSIASFKAAGGPSGPPGYLFFFGGP